MKSLPLPTSHPVPASSPIHSLAASPSKHYAVDHATSYTARGEWKIGIETLLGGWEKRAASNGHENRKRYWASDELYTCKSMMFDVTLVISFNLSSRSGIFHTLNGRPISRFTLAARETQKDVSPSLSQPSSNAALIKQEAQ